MTVTYGERQAYVEVLLERAFAEGVGSVLLLSNGPNPALSAVIARHPARIKLVELPRNEGSAIGYGVAIEAACKGTGNYLWLMDDDNSPAPGALRRLLDALAASYASWEPSRSAVLGYRADRQGNLARGIPVTIEFPSRGSFIGFDWRLVSFKIRRRLRKLKTTPLSDTSLLSIPYAPFGGFLAHKDAYQAMGLPRSDFMLYGDDHEYTLRLTENSGVIQLARGAEIIDQEPAWFIEDTSNKNSFARYLEDGSDFRTYYTVRNRTVFDKYRHPGAAFNYWLNKSLFLLVMRYYARKLGKPERLEVLLTAIQDGEAQRLGANPAYPLP